ncbi:MAG: DNA mismatch repair endonuclease MutL [bacterium]
MANRIKILPEELANKIAAGEVIERPASVVKELVENAIDAESTHIVVRVRAGGTQLISVEDNGVGMSAEDAAVAFHRHATSKIGDISDLGSIGTLGFRGEALPSIGAVSRSELSTREEKSLSATTVIVQGGKISEVGEAGRAVGTTVTVKHLFSNTPARRKFLRSTSTELRHITATIVNYAIVHPEIGFVLHHNERELFRWPKAESLKQRLQAIYGAQLLKDALPLNYSGEGFLISGWVGRPETARSSKVHQFVFVNRRPIVSQLIYHAIFEGYQPQLPKGKYPLAVVMLEMDPDRVDVNVHPTKKEVRFTDERSVHRAVVSAVRTALGGREAAPQWSPSPRRADLSKEIAARFPFTVPSIQRDVKGPTSLEPAEEPEERELTFAPVEGKGREEPRREVDVLPEEKGPLWQLHRRYILAQIRDGAVIIDQHAAHERVLYERAKRSFGGKRGTGQQLLFPLTLELSVEELGVMAEALPLFQQLGFSIKLFGGNTVVVEAVPAIIKGESGEKVIMTILDSLIETGKRETDIRERMAISFACKTAIKDGDPLSQEEMNHLIDMLFATQNPYACPHGRPTFIRMPLSELDRKFKR